MRPTHPRKKETKMNEKIASAKALVRKYQVPVLTTVAVVSTTAAVLFKMGLNSHDEFLKEHDLYDTYYALDEE